MASRYNSFADEVGVFGELGVEDAVADKIFAKIGEFVSAFVSTGAPVGLDMPKSDGESLLSACSKLISALANKCLVVSSGPISSHHFGCIITIVMKSSALNRGKFWIFRSCVQPSQCPVDRAELAGVVGAAASISALWVVLVTDHLAEVAFVGDEAGLDFLRSKL